MHLHYRDQPVEPVCDKLSTYSEIHKKHINTLVGENVDLLDFELDGTYSTMDH
jgi:hypothetical protein